MVDGIINVYKEKGYTSHDVVAKLRGIFRQKRIGHTGTLDPDAEGVLPVCLGKATKACGMVTEKDKVYQAALLLGKITDTQDITGTVLSECQVLCSQAQVEKAIASFVGGYAQVPPMYSALKVNGKKLCDLARAGIEVERKPREVAIYSIQIEEVFLPKVQMQVHCSKGTYIRALCHDIGEKLGCGGCMESLVRLRAAGFELKDSFRLGEIEARVRAAREANPQGELTKESLEGLVNGTDVIFQHYPKASVKPEFAKLLHNGNRLRPEWMEAWGRACESSPLRVYDERQIFAGIYQWDGERKDIRPIKIFA